MKKLVLILMNTVLLTVAGAAKADNLIADDLIVTGSQCLGTDCADGESFSYDTLRMKENNLRIRFTDTSASSSFPTQDWQITINDSANGGESYFAVEDIDAGSVPFYVGANAPSDSIHINGSGYVGFGTATPLVNVDVNSDNTPTLRLEQDITGGFTAQSWDIGGNETNFFIRDVTNGSTLPFRIVPGATDASLFIAADGDIGLKTSSPDGLLDVAHPSNANNHALLISPSGNVGINIDNGYSPNDLFDVQTSSGASLFLVKSNGDIMLSDSWRVTGVSSGSFKIESTGNASTRIELKDDGSIVIGDGITIDSSGDVTVTNLTVTGTCTGC